jgi:CHASE3 domain sensor protein
MLKNFKIKTKLFLAFGAIIIGALISGTINLINLITIEEKVDEIVSVNYPKTILVRDMADSINTIARNTRNLVLASTEEEIKKDIMRINDSFEALERQMERLDSLVEYGKAQNIVDEIKQRYAIFKPAVNNIIDGMNNSDRDAALDELLSGESRTQQRAIFALLYEINNIQTQELTMKGNETTAKTNNSMKITIIIFSFVTLLGVFLAIGITSSIAKPINQSVEMAKAIANGEFDKL